MDMRTQKRAKAGKVRLRDEDCRTSRAVTSLLTRPSLLCSTWHNVMQNSCANPGCRLFVPDAVSLPEMRISNPNLRAGNKA